MDTGENRKGLTFEGGGSREANVETEKAVRTKEEEREKNLFYFINGLALFDLQYVYHGVCMPEICPLRLHFPLP